MQNREPFRNIISKLKSGRSVTVTVDFSCLDKLIQPDMEAVWGLNKGILELKAAKDIVDEFDKANPNVKQKLMEQYLGLSKLKPSPGAVFGQCMFGEVAFNEPPTTRDEKDADYYFSEFRKLMFPRASHMESNFHDVRHISIHYLFCRDVFLTRNSHHFKPHKLQERFKDIVVLDPQQLLYLVSATLGNPQVKS